jgi:hypothetical protein
LRELADLIRQAAVKMREVCPEVWQRKVALDHLSAAELWARQSLPADQRGAE